MSEDRKSALPEHLAPLFGAGGLADKAISSVESVVGGQVEKISGSRLGRAARLSSLAVRSGTKILVDRARQALTGAEGEGSVSVEVAAQMLSTFSELRGVAMKLGQMLSYIDDALPEETRKILVILQRDAPPMPWFRVRNQLVEAFGASPEEVFRAIDKKPMAAASIGQVHRAELPDGTPVAVKIQYPGIDEAMKADLKNARLVSLMKQMLFFRTDIKSIFGELEERFMDECDYEKEATYQEEYHRRFAGHPWIVVPAVHRTFSTRRVLTTTLYEGQTFYEWLATNPSEADRARNTRLFYRFYLGSLYLDGLFNCDPHPGNYLFLRDGKVVFLDYGCSRRFSAERLEHWIALCIATFSDDAARLDELAYRMGFIPEGLEYDREAFRSLMRYIYSPYLEDAPYEFSAHRAQNTFRRIFLDNPNLFRMNMPADAVFLNRISFGLVSLLSAIGATMNCRRHVESYFRGIDPDWPDDPRRGLTPVASRSGA